MGPHDHEGFIPGPENRGKSLRDHEDPGQDARRRVRAGVAIRVSARTLGIGQSARGEFGPQDRQAVRDAADAARAAACQVVIWESLGRQGVREDDPATWPPVVEIGSLSGEPFVAAGTSPALTACDELIWPWPVDSVGRCRRGGAHPPARRCQSAESA